MSAFVLNQEGINLLTQATQAVLELNKKYRASYPLNDETVKLIGQYEGDLHNIYRALYITNIKAVNGRYGEDQKTLPKYQKLNKWDIGRTHALQHNFKKACGMFGCYMYQISEEPIFDSPVYKAFSDIYKLLCMIYTSQSINWEGENE